MKANPDADPNMVGEALQRLTSITACQIGTIVLDPSLDISEVTEIFVRINGYNDKNFYNQVANYAYLDTGVNISIGKKEPKEYFSEALAGCSGTQTVGTITDETEFWANLDANCIPHEVVNMTYADYTEFLKQRRVMMAQKIRKYYEAL